MSVRCIDAVFTGSKSTGATRLVLLALADCAADTGEITAYARSHSTLMAKANVSRATVRRAIDELVTLGEIEVLVQGTGRTKSDYRIRLDVLRDERVQDEPSQPEPSEGSPRALRGSNVSPQTVQDEPSITPSLPDLVPSPPVDPSAPIALTPQRLAGYFDAFWLAYPSKVGKGAARQAFAKACRQVHPQVIIDAVDAYKRSERVVKGFVANPATWLNQERWTDEHAPPGPRLQQSTLAAASWAERKAGGS